jgi:hypothetical protein
MGVRPIARWWRRGSPERGRHEPHTYQGHRSGEAPLFDYRDWVGQFTVWPDGTLEAGDGRRTEQVSLAGADDISVDYEGGDDLPVLKVRGMVWAQQTTVTVRDRLGKTTQVSVRGAIPVKVKQQLEEVVAGFVGKVAVSLAWAGARLLVAMAAEPAPDEAPRHRTVGVREHAAVLQAWLAADPDDGAALDAARRNPNEEAALRALATAIHHRAELDPGFRHELVALVHEAEQSGPTRWLDVAGGAGLGLAAAAAGALGWFLVVLLTDAPDAVVVAGLVGILVGRAVLWGSGAARSRRLQLISVGVTLLGLIAAEYLIDRHFLAEDGGGPVPVLLAPGEAIALVRDGLTADPWTLVFWALALWPAWRIPAPREGSGQGPRLPAATSRRWQVAGLAAGSVVLIGLGVSAAMMATAATGTGTEPKLPIVKLDRTANVGVFHIHLTTMTCGYPTLAGLGAAKRGQYCIVELTATNIRASPDRLDDANQRLSVATGESFEGFGFGDPLWKDELKPGQRLTTRLLFDLPRGVRPAQLRLQANAYQHSGRDTATINLPQH